MPKNTLAHTHTLARTRARSLADCDEYLDSAVLSACVLEVGAGCLGVKGQGLTRLHQLNVTQLDGQIILVKLYTCCAARQQAGGATASRGHTAKVITRMCDTHLA